MHTVYVIGAGVTGLSCAWQLAKTGYKVTVYHKDPLGSGASAAAAGLLKPFNATQTGWKQRLQQQNLWAYASFIDALKKDSSTQVLYTPCGRVSLYHSPKGWKAVQKAIALTKTQWPQAQKKLIPSEISTPYLNTKGAVGALYCPATAIFNPQNFLKALHEACLKYGVFFKQKTFSLADHGNTPCLITAGAYTQKLLPSLQVMPIKKQALLLRWPYAQPLEHVVENGQVYCVPKPEEDGIYIGATTEPEKGFCTEPTKTGQNWLRKEASALFPALAQAPLIKHIVALQNKCVPDKSTHPERSSLYLGKVEGYENVFAAVGHGGVGFCLAPASAQHILAELQRYFPIK